jgi:hypothetical protein
MRKLTQGTWNKIHNDYKMIKDDKKYAMVDSCILEPIEIDNSSGEFFVNITFRLGNLQYNEIVSGIYNPLIVREENFKNIIKNVVNYNEEYKYFIDNNKFTIISIDNRY